MLTTPNTDSLNYCTVLSKCYLLSMLVQMLKSIIFGGKIIVRLGRMNHHQSKDLRFMFARLFYQVGVFMGVCQIGFIASLRFSKSIKDIIKAISVGVFRILPRIVRKKLVIFFYKLS